MFRKHEYWFFSVGKSTIIINNAQMIKKGTFQYKGQKKGAH